MEEKNFLKISMGMFFVLSGFTLLLFQNCGSGYFSTNNRFGEANGSVACATDPALVAEVFETTFQPLLRSYNCQECHDLGGQKSDAPLASGDSGLASGAFNKIGADNVVAKMASGHNVTNYPDIQAEVREALGEWNAAGIGQCSNGQFETEPQTLDFFEEGGVAGNDQRILDDVIRTQRIEWDLGEMTPPLPGVTVSISVEIVGSEETLQEDASEQERTEARRRFSRFNISSLRITSPNEHIFLDGVTVLLNGTPSSTRSWGNITADVDSSTIGVNPADFSPLNGQRFSDVVKSNANEWQLRFNNIYFTE